MIPFVILADLRTGSTLLSSSLNAHPRVRCFGELFHPWDLADNQIPGRSRYDASGREVIDLAMNAQNADASGFRAMVFLPLQKQPQWSDAWEALADMPDLRVISLERENKLAQYVSLQIASRTGRYHPPPDDPVLDPENRPRVEVCRDALEAWIAERDRLRAERAQLLEGKPTLDVTYEAVTTRWPETTRRIQEFLEVEPVELTPRKSKQESRPLSEVVVNYAAVQEFDV